MHPTNTYAHRAVNQPASSIAERHRLLAEPADACLSWLEVPGYRDCYLYLYPDGSIAACSVTGTASTVTGRWLTILTAIFRACAELPNPCPCPLVCCPESHLRCCKCDATADLVLVGTLPLALRRTWCRSCHRQSQLAEPDHFRPPTTETARPIREAPA